MNCPFPHAALPVLLFGWLFKQVNSSGDLFERAAAMRHTAGWPPGCRVPAALVVVALFLYVIARLVETDVRGRVMACACSNHGQRALPVVTASRGHHVVELTQRQEQLWSAATVRAKCGAHPVRTPCVIAGR
jgi:hypothetical protein